jgi:hypothetical protein
MVVGRSRRVDESRAFNHHLPPADYLPVATVHNGTLFSVP